MDKLKPKAVIFDLGSTLIEYEAVPWDELSRTCVAAGHKMLVKKGISVPGYEEFNEAFDRIKLQYREKASRDLIEWTVPGLVAQLFEEVKIEASDGLADRFFDAYYAPVAKQLFAFDDTAATLEAIRDQFDIVGLISNTIFPEATHLQELERFEIAKYFDFTVFSSTLGVRKPHPDIFNKATNLAGYAPSECVYVGDRYLEDVVGPTKVGMPAILKVKPDREYPAEMPEATRRIDTLSELRDHLEFSVD
jgi:HAD superfamily hydrolase (TIGR01549 family)